MVNQRTGEILFTEVMRARRPKDRVKGLLGTTSFPSGAAIVIEPARQVHTFGMKYPIDVIFCDDEMKVIGVLAAVAPARLTPLRWRARCIIECAAGAASGVKEGDRLAFQPIDL